MMPKVRRLFFQLISDKKKLSLMLGLLLVALLLWGRLMLKQVPRTAIATPPDEASASVEGDASERTTHRQIVYVDLPKILTRDLFVINPDLYTRIASYDHVRIGLEKLPSNPADDLLRGIRGPNGLVLQTTILGDQPRAVINGQVVLVGQKIRGFTVKKIMSRQVIIEKNGIKIRLEM